MRRSRQRQRLTDDEITNIIFRESRSLLEMTAGAGARKDLNTDLVFAILNGTLLKLRPPSAPTTLNAQAIEELKTKSVKELYDGIKEAVRQAKVQWALGGTDPVDGADLFNNRWSTDPWYNSSTRRMGQVDVPIVHEDTGFLDPQRGKAVEAKETFSRTRDANARAAELAKKKK